MEAESPIVAEEGLMVEGVEIFGGLRRQWQCG